MSIPGLNAGINTSQTFIRKNAPNAQTRKTVLQNTNNIAEAMKNNFGAAQETKSENIGFPGVQISHEPTVSQPKQNTPEVQTERLPEQNPVHNPSDKSQPETTSTMQNFQELVENLRDKPDTKRDFYTSTANKPKSKPKTKSRNNTVTHTPTQGTQSQGSSTGANISKTSKYATAFGGAALLVRGSGASSHVANSGKNMLDAVNQGVEIASNVNDTIDNTKNFLDELIKPSGNAASASSIARTTKEVRVSKFDKVMNNVGKFTNSKFMKGLGRATVFVTAAIEGFNVGRAFSEPVTSKERAEGIDTQAKKGAVQICKSAGSVAGAWAGGKAGAWAGAAIGTMICPGIGTAIGGAIGAVGGAILGSKYGGMICEAVGKGCVKAYNYIRDNGAKLVKGVGNAVKTVGKAVGTAVKTVGKATKAVGKAVGTAVKTVGKAAKAVGKAVGTAVKTVGKAAKAVGKAAGAAVKTVAKAGKAVGKAVKTVGKAVGKAAGAAVKTVAKAGKAVGKAVASAGKAVGKALSKLNPFNW